MMRWIGYLAGAIVLDSLGLSGVATACFLICLCLYGLSFINRVENHIDRSSEDSRVIKDLEWRLGEQERREARQRFLDSHPDAERVISDGRVQYPM